MVSLHSPNWTGVFYRQPELAAKQLERWSKRDLSAKRDQQLGLVVEAVSAEPVHCVTISHSVEANVAWWINWSKPIVTKKRCQFFSAQNLDDTRLVM